MSHYLVGSSEAEERARAWSRESSREDAGVNYPSATNNRGFEGRREHHAYGDMIGGNVDNNVRMGDQQNDQYEPHARGDMTGSSLPSQGGCHQSAKSRSASSNMPSQGGSHMKPMSGDTSSPRSKGSRYEKHARGDMVGDEREEHGFGDMIGRQFNRAKRAAAPVVNQGVNYAKQQARNVGSSAKNYASQQAQHVGDEARNYGSQQLAKGSAHLAGMGNPPTQMKRGGEMMDDDREHHSWGSFVRGANKTAKTVGRGINSAAKTVGKGINTAAKAAAPIAKNVASSIAKKGVKTAMNHPEMAASLL